MQKNELIRLDGALVDVIDHAVFSAMLENGHLFVAVAKRRNGDPMTGLQAGDRVTVEFSPFDMSTARVICGSARDEVNNEST